MLGVKTARPGAIADDRFRFPTVYPLGATSAPPALARIFILTISHIGHSRKPYVAGGGDLEGAA